MQMICHFEAQDFKYMDIKYEDLIKFIMYRMSPIIKWGQIFKNILMLKKNWLQKSMDWVIQV